MNFLTVSMCVSLAAVAVIYVVIRYPEWKRYERRNRIKADGER